MDLGGIWIKPSNMVNWLNSLFKFKCQIWQTSQIWTRAIIHQFPEKRRQIRPNITAQTSTKTAGKKDLSRFWLSCFSSFEIAHDWPWTAHYVRNWAFEPQVQRSVSTERGHVSSTWKAFTAYDNDISRMMATAYSKEIKKHSCQNWREFRCVLQYTWNTIVMFQGVRCKPSEMPVPLKCWLLFLTITSNFVVRISALQAAVTHFAGSTLHGSSEST